MTQYFCMIDLKSDARALGFAAALEAWMEHLRSAERIETWRLLRRKLNLATDEWGDFLLEITVRDLAQLDRAFRFLGQGSDEATARHDQLRQHIARVRPALYRPYPDPERVERLALI